MKTEIQKAAIVNALEKIEALGCDISIGPGDPLNPECGWEVRIESHAGIVRFSGPTLVAALEEVASEPTRDWRWVREYTKTSIVK